MICMILTIQLGYDDMAINQTEFTLVMVQMNLIWLIIDNKVSQSFCDQSMNMIT